MHPGVAFLCNEQDSTVLTIPTFASMRNKETVEVMTVSELVLKTEWSKQLK